jgi:hypothetical protein
LGPGLAGATLSQVITLTAVNGPVEVISISITGAGWSLSGTGWTPGIVSTRGSQTFTVSVTQVANGSYTGQVTLNTTDGIYTIKLTALYQAGLVISSILPMPTNRPGTTVSILSATQVGTLVTLNFASPFYYAPLTGIRVQLGVNGYDGDWFVASISSDHKSLTYNAVATGLAPFISGTAVPPGLGTALDRVVIFFENPNAVGNINITSIEINDSTIEVPSNLVFPIVFIPLAMIGVSLFYDHSLLGQKNFTITVDNNGSVTPLIINQSTFSVSIFSDNPLTGTNKKLVFGDTLGDTYGADYLPGQSSEPGAIQLNNPLWDNPGVEKILQRLEIYYENLGICQLGLNIQVWRPTLNAGAGGFDTKIVSIQIGDASADGSDRSAYFDLQISGELILATITRPINLSGGGTNGPCSITGLTPHFSDVGEKVEGV